MHASSQCACMHVPNVMPRDVIVHAINVLVVLVEIINKLRSYRVSGETVYAFVS